MNLLLCLSDIIHFYILVVNSGGHGEPKLPCPSEALAKEGNHLHKWIFEASEAIAGRGKLETKLVFIK